MKDNKNILEALKLLRLTALGLLAMSILLSIYSLIALGFFHVSKKSNLSQKQEIRAWKLTSLDLISNEKDADLIKYGHDLVANTAYYLGPKGKVAHLTNGMNCQNCHLEAGTKPWGNNYGAVSATYPKFRERSGTQESIIKRVNDCMERSLNGKSLDSSSHEMQAMVSYIKFLGRLVPKDSIPEGTGIWKLKFMNRAADPTQGQARYYQKCANCHKKNGDGVLKPDGTGYTYPPLWGPHSYNLGAGLYRITRLAGYIKTNMPFGVDYKNPQLSDEEAWDIAAYINSRPRPSKDLSKDWPTIEAKPTDHPFGPYADFFTEEQHKFGPFKPIDDFKKAQKRHNYNIKPKHCPNSA